LYPFGATITGRQTVMMTRAALVIRAGDDAERSDEEERRS
jgi:hypothetical protein